MCWSSFVLSLERFRLNDDVSWCETLIRRIALLCFAFRPKRFNFFWKLVCLRSPRRRLSSQRCASGALPHETCREQIKSLLLLFIVCIFVLSISLSLPLSSSVFGVRCLSLLICTAVCCFSSTFTIFNCNIFLLNFIAVIKVIILWIVHYLASRHIKSYRITHVIPFGKMKYEKRAHNKQPNKRSGRTSRASNMAFLLFLPNSKPNRWNVYQMSTISPRNLWNRETRSGLIIKLRAFLLLLDCAFVSIEWECHCRLHRTHGSQWRRWMGWKIVHREERNKNYYNLNAHILFEWRRRRRRKKPYELIMSRLYGFHDMKIICYAYANATHHINRSAAHSLYGRMRISQFSVCSAPLPPTQPERAHTHNWGR